jgi:hypothetical protein
MGPLQIASRGGALRLGARSGRRGLGSHFLGNYGGDPGSVRPKIVVINWLTAVHMGCFDALKNGFAGEFLKYLESITNPAMVLHVGFKLECRFVISLSIWTRCPGRVVVEAYRNGVSSPKAKFVVVAPILITLTPMSVNTKSHWLITWPRFLIDPQDIGFAYQIIQMSADQGAILNCG